MEKETTAYIIQKGNLFFQADARYFFGTDKRPVFSQYVFNAKRFRHEEDAIRRAKQYGGRVRLFDWLNGTIL